MPYIKTRRRSDLHTYEQSDIPEVAGELNYLFTEIIVDYLQTKGLSYQTGNDVLGALDACAREFYDRVMRPYEDKKIKENGDVYPREFLSLPPDPVPDMSYARGYAETATVEYVELPPADPSTILRPGWR